MTLTLIRLAISVLSFLVNLAFGFVLTHAKLTQIFRNHKKR